MCLLKFFRRRKNKPAEEPVTVPEPADAEVQSSTVEAEKPVEKPAEVRAVETEKAVITEKPAEAKKPVNVQKTVAVKKDGKTFIRVKYNRSFTAKLIQSDDKQKSYYGEIKNCLLGYKVKTRTSWRYETFKTGRKLLAKISFRGKTLGLYLALDPKAYDGTKYKIDDVSSVANNADVPALYKIKNDRRCKYSKDLIAAVMEANGLVAGETPTEDYAAIYPYEEIEPLIERKLVKLLNIGQSGEGAEEGLIEISEEKYEELIAEEAVEEVREPQYPEVVESITVVEAEEKIDDEVVETFIQESERFSDKTRKDIVNIDVLGKYFNAGDEVTIEEIKKRVPSVNKKATYIKVLARGTLSKALNVEADDFSPAAVKMIVLTGGTVTRTKKKN